MRMEEGLVGGVPPSNFLGEGESTLEVVDEYFSDYGEEWSLVVEPEKVEKRCL